MYSFKKDFEFHPVHVKFWHLWTVYETIQVVKNIINFFKRFPGIYFDISNYTPGGDLQLLCECMISGIFQWLYFNQINIIKILL